jgi:exosome complex RNA-binding protein Rrp42 (RNase PH superfamily)
MTSLQAADPPLPQVLIGGGSTDFHLHHLAHGIRTDGRQPHELRQVTCRPTALSTCTRAFILRWGHAMLLAGIRPEVAAIPLHSQTGGGALGKSPSLSLSLDA